MLIAQEKKKENLAEYILYMWQVEDFIRACNFDMQTIEKQRIHIFEITEEEHKQIYNWYENLLVMMQKEQIIEKGHLQILKNNIEELTDLHFGLLYKENDDKYRQLFFTAAQALLEMRQKSQVSEVVGDIEVALTAMYGVLMLRLSGKEVTKTTLQALEPISRMLAYLSLAYKEEEAKLLKSD